MLEVIDDLEKKNKWKVWLKDYSTPFPEEEAFKLRFLALLNYDNCFERTNLEGHFTASAFIYSPKDSKFLLLHHAKLDRWLQPGGHADGETNLGEVAKKEAIEETGLELKSPESSSFFDIDIHFIPARNEVEGHYHFDVRYLFLIDSSQEPVKNHESKDIKWFTETELKSLDLDASIIRVMEKIKNANLL
jgi:8-oxo-dGTP pyrophosphatase MutT (NUDIX family)